MTYWVKKEGDVKKFKHLIVGSLAVVALSLGTTSTTFAHVTVKPSEVPSATYQLFTVSVPNEKEQATTALRLVIPEGVSSVTPSQKDGWTITTTQTNGLVSEITWADGSIAPERRDDFTFSAKTPAETIQLKWKAYQTYADGTIVAWDQEASTDGHMNNDSGPFSVTEITSEDAPVSDTSGQAAAQVALFAAATAVGISLIAVYMATRKK